METKKNTHAETMLKLEFEHKQKMKALEKQNSSMMMNPMMMNPMMMNPMMMNNQMMMNPMMMNNSMMNNPMMMGVIQNCQVETPAAPSSNEKKIK